MEAPAGLVPPTMLGEEREMGGTLILIVLGIVLIIALGLWLVGERGRLMRGSTWRMLRDRPALVIGFGGYPSIPALAAACPVLFAELGRLFRTEEAPHADLVGDLRLLQGHARQAGRLAGRQPDGAPQEHQRAAAAQAAGYDFSRTHCTAREEREELCLSLIHISEPTRPY